MIAQVELGFAAARKRPLWHLETCMDRMDRDEDELLDLITIGRLRWVWDIKAPDADRRELRVWSESVDAAMEGRVPAHLRLTEEQVYELILPPVRSHFRSTELKRFFSASQTHVQHLIDTKCLPMAGHGGAGTHRPLHGPNSFSRVRREDVIAFLKARCLQANL